MNIADKKLNDRQRIQEEIELVLSLYKDGFKICEIDEIIGWGYRSYNLIKNRPEFVGNSCSRKKTIISK